jgi:hypothetical protein
MDFVAVVRVWETTKGSVWAELREDVVERAVRYAGVRVEWLLAPAERRADMEEAPTRCHDAFISSLDIFARNLVARGRRVVAATVDDGPQDDR